MTAEPESTGVRSDRSDLRVVLVARLGAAPALESSLRRDGSVEFIRARDPLDAVGEVACPIDLHSPRRTLVLVSLDAVPASEAPEFCAAVRRVDEGVRVLALVDREYPASCGSGYDGEAPLDSSVAALRRMIDGPPVARAAGPAIVPAGEDGGEMPALRAVIAGRDVLGPCVEEIRRRLGDPEAEFVKQEADAEELCVGEPVEHRGRRFGRLVTRAGVESARSEAAWLAHWLLLQQQQAQLRQAAFTDPLTGLWNRRYFERRLETSLDHARARRAELSVLVFDIDNFKTFNDRHSHAIGDQILCEMAGLIRSVVRPSDRVCRIGGDEFAVVFYDPDGPREAAAEPGSSRHALSIAKIATRFQRVTAARCFPKLGREGPGALSISGGIATFPWDATDAEGLVDLADRRALESKSLGKNTITFGPETH